MGILHAAPLHPCKASLGALGPPLLWDTRSEGNEQDSCARPWVDMLGGHLTKKPGPSIPSGSLDLTPPSASAHGVQVQLP